MATTPGNIQPLGVNELPESSYAGDFMRTWSNRLNQAQAAGVDVTKLAPIIQKDWRRVKNGSSPYSNIEAGLMSHAVLTGKPLINVQEHQSGDGLIGGILHGIGNIPGDIGDIAAGLNPMTLVPNLVHMGERAVNHPEQIVKPLETLASGDITKAFEQASKAPLLQLIPGIYTAKNVLEGNWDEIVQHPVMTTLDVLPYAAKVGKLATAGAVIEGTDAARAAEAARAAGEVAPEVVSKSSAKAALIQGKPLKAGFRAALGTTESPSLGFLPTAPLSAENSRILGQWNEARLAAEKAGEDFNTAKPTFIRTQDIGKLAAEKTGFDSAIRDIARKYAINRRAMIGEPGRELWQNLDADFEGMSLQDQLAVMNHAQRVDFNSPEFVLADPAEQQLILKYRQMADDVAEPYAYNPIEEQAKKQAALEAGEEYVKPSLKDKRLIAIPNEQGILEYYPLNSKVGKSFQKMLDQQEAMAGHESALEAATNALEESNASEEAIRNHAVIEDKYNTAKAKLERFQEQFQKQFSRNAPARYGELLKDQVKGELAARIKQASEENVMPVYRYSDNSLVRDLQGPSGQAFVGFDPRDWEAVSGGRELQSAELRPQQPLHVRALNATEGLGEAVLRHFNESETGRVIGDRASAGDVAGAIQYAEDNLPIKFSAEEKRQLLKSDQPYNPGISSGQMQDMVAAKLAREYGHDVVVKEVAKGGEMGAEFRPHEAVVLDKKALLSEQKTPVITSEQAAEAAQHVTEGNFAPLVQSGIISEGDLKGIVRDVQAGWQELARQGYDPVYVPNAPAYKTKYLLDQKPQLGNLYEPRQFLNKESLSFAPQAQNMAIAYTSYGVELMKRAASQEMFNQVRSLAVSEKQIAERYGVDIARRKLATEYVPFSETAGRYLTKSELSMIPDADKLFIPRGLDRNLNRILEGLHKEGLLGVYDNAMKVYKYSILTGPRHVAHVMFGGLMFMMGEHGVTAFPKFFEALKRVRNEEIPVDMARGLDYFTPKELQNMPEKVAEVAQGKSLGRIFVKSLGSPFKAMKVFEELTADTQRMMTYLREMDKQAAKGLVGEAQHNAAMALTNKIYMDIDGLAPVERTVLRHIFPFYSFTKHIMRYAMNYAADHPWRAAILSNIIRIEQEDQATGLPSMFNDFIFFGNKDKNGNETAIDVKNFNPFRSLDGQSPLTLAGFLSALTPAATIPMQMAGVNVLTATPELYPQLHYDTKTGKLVASHPDMLSQAMQLALPPTGALQGLLQLTENWKALKKSDPAAYNRALWGALNIPFVPQVRNKGLESAKAEVNRYKAAQQASVKALKTGDTSLLQSYNYVPFQGTLYPTEQVTKLIKLLRQLSPTGSPGMIVPRTHSGKQHGLVGSLTATP